MTPFAWDRFYEAPIVAILRGFPVIHVAPIAEALNAGGLTTLEVTMNSPDAPAQIRAAIEAGRGRINVGAGTVLGIEALETALAAGASFIVTPCINPAVIAAAVARGLPIFPGALSPTEVAAAASLGVKFVKVFPADQGGPAYLARLADVFPAIGLLPTGGVDLKCVPVYRAAGAAGVGVGSPLLDKARVRAGDWKWLTARARAFRDAWEVVLQKRDTPSLNPASAAERRDVRDVDTL